MTNLLISIGISLESYGRHITKLNIQLNSDLVSRNQMINVIRDNIEYIKYKIMTY